MDDCLRPEREVHQRIVSPLPSHYNKNKHSFLLHIRRIELRLYCTKQRKRAALVAKFERSPVNFKFVCPHLKIAVFEVVSGRSGQKFELLWSEKWLCDFEKVPILRKSMLFP